MVNKQELAKIKEMIFKETDIWCRTYPDNERLLRNFSVKIRMELGRFQEENYNDE